MEKDYGAFERYSDEMQNAGVCAREHEKADQMTREERLLFGLNDAVLRHREALHALRDENGFAEEEQN